MRAIIRISLVALAVGMTGAPARPGGSENRTPELDAAARAFLKAYRAKDLDALMAATDAPFLVGTLGDPRKLSSGADVRAELKSRLASGNQLPGRVAKTLTWEQALAPEAGADEARRMRQRLKQVIAVTGEGGGYAALADDAGSGRGRRLLAISDTRLLVGIRGGRAKVVGIVVDEPGKR
jgi:hypothetical protein